MRKLLKEAEFIQTDTLLLYNKAVELSKTESCYKVRGSRPPESLESIIGEIHRRIEGTPRTVAANTVQGTVNAWSLKQLRDGIALWSLLVETARKKEQLVQEPQAKQAAAQQSPSSRQPSPGQRSESGSRAGPRRNRGTRTW